MIVCDDVLHWAEKYDGPPAMAMICDPPYHLIADTRNGSQRNPGTGPYGRHTISTKGFMNSEWDGAGPDGKGIAFRPETWAALARHLLPGAFVMAFASSRGWHRLACAMEDAGLVIHPSIFGWAYGEGWPKATRIDVAIDKAAGAEREVLGTIDTRSTYDGKARSSPALNTNWRTAEGREDIRDLSQKVVTAPATPLAQAWAGHRYGLQALKPALEPIIVAQVPYSGRPVDSITRTGAGALWIDGGRLPCPGGSPSQQRRETARQTGHAPGRPGQYRETLEDRTTPETYCADHPGEATGRWPANFTILHTLRCRPLGTRQVHGKTDSKDGTATSYTSPDGTETVQAWACAEGCPVAALDAQAGKRPTNGRHGESGNGQPSGMFGNGSARQQTYFDEGSVSRFFYTANWAMEVAEQLAQADPVHYEAKASQAERSAGLQARNSHATVKPISLCTWLAKLLLPPTAYAPRRLLVPFSGTSSEMIGGIRAGFEMVLGIEQDQTYAEIGRKRIAWWTGHTMPSPSHAEMAKQETTVSAVSGQLTLF